MPCHAGGMCDSQGTCLQSMLAAAVPLSMHALLCGGSLIASYSPACMLIKPWLMCGAVWWFSGRR